MLNGKGTVVLLIVGLKQMNSINGWIFSKAEHFRNKC